MKKTSGGSVKPESVETFVVYSGDTGEIHHVHQVINFHGADQRYTQDVETHARSLARRRFPFVENLKVLRVPNDVLRPGLVHAVDLNTLTLVALSG